MNANINVATYGTVLLTARTESPSSQFLKPRPTRIHFASEIRKVRRCIADLNALGQELDHVQDKYRHWSLLQNQYARDGPSDGLPAGACQAVDWANDRYFVYESKSPKGGGDLCRSVPERDKRSWHATRARKRAGCFPRNA